MLNIQDFFGEEALNVFSKGKREALREGFSTFGVRHMVLGVILSERGMGADLLGPYVEVLRDETVTEPPDDLAGLHLETAAGTAQILQAAIGFALNGGLRQIMADHLLAACLAYDDITPPDDAVPRLRAAGADMEEIIGALSGEIRPSSGGGLVAAEVEQAVGAVVGMDAPKDVALLAAICGQGHPVLKAMGLTQETVLAATPSDADQPALEELIQGAVMQAMMGGAGLRVTLDDILGSLLEPTPNIEAVLAAHGLSADEVSARLAEEV